MSAVFEMLKGNQYITEMLAACILFVIPHRKRRYFPVRIVLFCAAAEISSFFLMNSPGAKAIWQTPSNVVISCCIFIFAFAVISVVFIGFCCPVTTKELVYCAALSLCIQHFSSAFQLLLFGLIPGEGLWYGLAVELVTIPLVYVLFYQFSIRRICENGSYRLDNLRLTAATCLIFLVAAFTSVAVKAVYERTGGPLFLFCQIYEMLCCFFLMWIQVNQKQALEFQHELDMQNYLQHLRYEQLESSRQNTALLTHLMHELKHQVAGMVTQEDDPERDQLLEQIAENLQIYDASYYTKNEILNTVLMERSLYCRQQHIRIMCVADCEELQFLKTGDLYLLLRNGLDNAIEGVCTLEKTEHRLIDVKVYRKNQFLMIQIQNPFQGRLLFQNGLPRTTKKDPRFHGFGLKSIRQIAEKYGGDMAINGQGGWFSLRIILPIPEEHNQ